MFEHSIYAEKTKIGSKVEIGPGSIIIAKEVFLEDGVKIGANVELICDTLTMGKGSKFHSNIKLKSPEIIIEGNCTISEHLEAEFNEYFHMGRCSTIGKHVSMAGQGFRCGQFLWMKDHIIVGGGGCKGPRSYLTIGDQTTIIDRCYINLSESVEIGSNSALSMGVSLITHAAWQPSLMGFGTKFGSIKIGDFSVIFLNTSIMPGTNVGSYATVGAHSLVTEDIPDHCLAAGVPAKIKKNSEVYPKSLTSEEKDILVENILIDYLTTLSIKGVHLLSNTLQTDGNVTLFIENREVTITFFKNRIEQKFNGKADISISVETISPHLQGWCHFNLNSLQMMGEASPLSEDLRDYFRRRAIKILTGEPFKVLPLVNLARLNRMKKDLQHEQFYV